MHCHCSTEHPFWISAISPRCWMTISLDQAASDRGWERNLSLKPTRFNWIIHAVWNELDSNLESWFCLHPLLFLLRCHNCCMVTGLSYLWQPVSSRPGVKANKRPRIRNESIKYSWNSFSLRSLYLLSSWIPKLSKLFCFLLTPTIAYSLMFCWSGNHGWSPVDCFWLWFHRVHHLGWTLPRIFHRSTAAYEYDH